jgi:hypothetical protein
VRWLVRMDNQPPVVVIVDDARNLSAEFEHAATDTRGFWHWVTRRPRLWQITEQVTVDCHAVLGVEPLPKQKAERKRARIGFSIT